MYYRRSYVRGDLRTGSFMDSSTYDLICFAQVPTEISFRGEVVTPSVTATSVLTSVECQLHTSSI